MEIEAPRKLYWNFCLIEFVRCFCRQPLPKVAGSNSGYRWKLRKNQICSQQRLLQHCEIIFVYSTFVDFGSISAQTLQSGIVQIWNIREPNLQPVLATYQPRVKEHRQIRSRTAQTFRDAASPVRVADQANEAITYPQCWNGAGCADKLQSYSGLGSDRGCSLQIFWESANY